MALKVTTFAPNMEIPNRTEAKFVDLLDVTPKPLAIRPPTSVLLVVTLDL